MLKMIVGVMRVLNVLAMTTLIVVLLGWGHPRRDGCGADRVAMSTAMTIGKRLAGGSDVRRIDVMRSSVLRARVVPRRGRIMMMGIVVGGGVLGGSGAIVVVELRSLLIGRRAHGLAITLGCMHTSQVHIRILAVIRMMMRAGIDATPWGR